MDIVFEETQIATAELVFEKLKSLTKESGVVIFWEPAIIGREYSEIERFRISFQKEATVEEIKQQIAEAFRFNKIRWNRASYRKALAFGE